ncbi:MAG: carboxypeptidase-like regulatory domain-containing protein [Planctomycetota bacterium]
MSERDFEGWLEKQMPDTPSPDVDAKILAAGKAMLANRRAATQPSRWRGLAQAAAILLAITGGLLLSPWNPWRDAPTVETQRIAAAGNGSFQVTADASYETDPLSSWLRLEAGACTAEAVDVPLETAFPGGILRVERGRGSVQLFTEKEAVVEITKKKFKRGSVVVVLTLALGWGVVELNDGSQPLAVGAERVLVVEPAAVAGEFDVQDVKANTESAAPSNVAVAPSEPASVEDEATPKFRGRVVDLATGEPIAGARVGWVNVWVPGAGAIIVSHPKSQVFVGHPTSLVIDEELVQLPFTPDPLMKLRVEARTDDEGFYELPREREKEAEFLIVVADGYQPGFLREAPPEGETPVSALQVKRRVFGQVVAASGEELRGEAMRMTLRVVFDLPGHPDWQGSLVVYLEDDFSFDVDLGDVDDVKFTLSAASYEDLELSTSLLAGDNDVRLPLVDHAYLAGKVTDESGQPLAGVNVLVRSRARSLFSRSMNHFSATTNEAGQYLATTYGPVIEVTTEKEGYATGEFTKVPAGKPFDITLRPTENGALRGLVVDSRGNPIANANVRAIRNGVGVIRAFVLRTDDTGAFSASDLPPGKYRVVASPDMEAQQTDSPFPEEIGVVHIGVEQEEVVISAGAETAGVELRIAGGAIVMGTYRDEDGAPRKNERIALYRPDLLGGDHQRVAALVTDGEGHYAFHGVPSGTFAVYVEGLGNYKLVKVKGTGEHIVDVGGATSVFRGRLFRGSEPVARAAVAIGRIEEGGGLDTRIGGTDDDGRFSFERVARGRYVLHITDKQTDTVLLDIIDVTKDERELEIDWPTTVTTIDVSASPVPAGTELLLELVDIPGIPIAQLVPASYLRIAKATTEDGATFELTGISPGHYRASLLGVEPARSVEIRVQRRNATFTLD